MALILIFKNISNLDPVSDYNYEVLVGDGTPEHSNHIAAGTRRSDGWKALVRRIVQED